MYVCMYIYRGVVVGTHAYEVATALVARSSCNRRPTCLITKKQKTA